MRELTGKRGNTAVTGRTPAMECGGLGARFESGDEGNWRGGRGDYIAQRGEGNHRVYGRIHRGGEISSDYVISRRRKGKEDVSVTSRLTRCGPDRWVPPVSRCEEKKRDASVSRVSWAALSRFVG